MFQKVDDDHLVECAVGEGRSTAIQLVDVITDQLPDGGNRSRVEVSAAPSAASLPHEVADDPVVGADVQVGLARRIIEVRQNLPELCLLEDRAVE
jgi:hypothetical protein